MNQPVMIRPPKSRWQQLAGPAVILLAAAVATAPQVLRGNSCGHDFDFHLISWLDALDSWRQGIFYPHWSASANFGAGEPRFVFYPPITWMMGAALGSVLSWHAVPIALTFLLLVATGIGVRALARHVMPEGPATLAGCVAIFSVYALFTAYRRTAFGELTGGFWLPLLLLFMLRDRNPSASTWRRAFDGSAAPLAVVVAGAWLSNAPVGVMASYLLAAVALVLAWLWRSWAPVLRATTSVALGLGLSAFYLVPAAVEQRWVDIRQAIDSSGSRIEESWLFARHTDPALGSHDTVLRLTSLICVTMIGVTVAGLLLIWWRGLLPGLKKPRRAAQEQADTLARRTSCSPSARWWVPLALIPAAVLFLQFPISLLIWDALPKLRFLQFPWRWLVVLEAPMALFFAFGIWPKKAAPRWLCFAAIATCFAFFLASFAITTRYYFAVCEDEDAVPTMLNAYRTGTGFPGVDEYAPQDALNSLLAAGLPEACLTASADTVLGAEPPDADPENETLEWGPGQGSCEATFSAASYPGKARAEHLRIAAATEHAGYMILRLRSYPAWQVRVNGQRPQSLPHRDDGLMAVPVPQGHVELTVDWGTTGDVIAGRWISGIALALFTSLCFLERKQTRPRL